MGKKGVTVVVVVVVAAASVLVSGCEKAPTPAGGSPVVCVTPDDPGRGSCR